MAIESTKKSGAEVLSAFFQERATSGEAPLFEAIDLAPFLGETWSSATYTDGARFASTSAEGSSLSFLHTLSTGNRIEAWADDMSLTGSDGSRLTYKASGKQPAESQYGAIASSMVLDWNFVGNNRDKSDDVKVSAKISANDTISAHGQGWKFSGGSSVNFSVSQGENERQLTLQGKDIYTVIGSGSTHMVDDNTATLSVSYSDMNRGAPFKFAISGTLTNDAVANTASFSWKNANAQIGDLIFSTKIFSSSIDSTLNLGSLLDVDNTTEVLRDRWIPLLVKGNNTFTGGRSSDTIEASAGNDTVSGNLGDDFLEGGIGTDQLTGGAGADVFIFSTGDSAVSATAADQIKDFKFADGDQIQLSGLATIRAQVSRSKVSTLETAVAAANTGFASGNNVSIQFLQKNAVMLADMDGNGETDLAVMLVGLKAGDARLLDYAESGAMFT